MNDINWGGKVNNNFTLYFSTTLNDGTNINIPIPLGSGYYSNHVAAAFVMSWNSAVNISQFLAVADENTVRFPGGNIFAAARVFTVGANSQTLPEGGGVLTIVPGLKVRTAEADF